MYETLSCSYEEEKVACAFNKGVSSILTKMAVLFFFLSICSFLACLRFILATKRRGVYPPRYLLIMRSKLMAVIGTGFFLIGLMIKLFH